MGKAQERMQSGMLAVVLIGLALTNSGHNHKKAMKNLKTEVEGAKSPKDAAAKMKSTISKAMKSKEKELLSGSMPKKVEKRPEPPKPKPKPRRKKPYRSNTRELKQKEGEEKAKVKLAKSRGLRLAVQQKNAESQSRHRLNMKK